MTMNDYVCIGKIVNTHGIKGELRILSDFELKNKVFKKGVNLYVGPEKQEFTITGYRHHKMFDMVTLKVTGLSTKYTKYSHLVGGIIMLIIGLLLIIKPELLMFNF